MIVIPLYPVYSEANCYIAVCDSGCGNTECAVFDPGADAERIYKRAKQNGLEIKKIILTHAHFDHIMAVNKLYELTGAKVFIHSGDLQALYEPSLNLAGLGAGVDYTVNRNISVCSVNEGDKITVGNEYLTVMSTPGHTPGSSIFICGDIIFTGDTLFGGTIGRTDFPGGSISVMKDSLRRIASLNSNYTLYPGHSGETTLEREKKSNYYLQKEFLGI